MEWSGTYGDAAHRYVEREGLEAPDGGEAVMSDADWAGYRKTIRVEVADEAPEMGQYTAATRGE